MEIHLACGRGAAPTALAAFARALLDAGIANFNLTYLSSIIPPGSKLVKDKPMPKIWQWGDRLYLVIAQQRETEIGTEAWAGIGWVQDEDTGRGLFVEHHGNSEHFVEAQIHEGLNSMASLRPGSWGSTNYLTAGISCEHHPVCAVAAAIYDAASWPSLNKTSA